MLAFWLLLLLSLRFNFQRSSCTETSLCCFFCSSLDVNVVEDICLIIEKPLSTRH